MKENKKYRIKINYDTGDSFNHYTDQEKYVDELSWNNLDIAKENLKRIEEHYKYYLDLDKGYYRFEANKKQIEEKQKKRLNERWYSTKYPDVCMFLISDIREVVSISTFWTGYFETLNFAEIEEDNSDMKISFK